MFGFETQGLLIILLVGLVSGWLAGKLFKGSGFGFFGDLLVGIAGAFVGAFIFRLLGIMSYTLLGSIVMSVIGALVLLYIIRMVKK